MIGLDFAWATAAAAVSADMIILVVDAAALVMAAVTV